MFTFHLSTSFPRMLKIFQVAFLYIIFLVILLTDEGHEAISIRLVTELLHQGLGLLLGQLLSEVGQQTEELM